MIDERVETDLLIVGSGFAGLWAAISAREAGVERVAVVDDCASSRSGGSDIRRVPTASTCALPPAAFDM